MEAQNCHYTVAWKYNTVLRLYRSLAYSPIPASFQISYTSSPSKVWLSRKNPNLDLVRILFIPKNTLMVASTHWENKKPLTTVIISRETSAVGTERFEVTGPLAFRSGSRLLGSAPASLGSTTEAACLREYLYNEVPWQWRGCAPATSGHVMGTCRSSRVRATYLLSSPIAAGNTQM